MQHEASGIAQTRFSVPHSKHNDDTSLNYSSVVELNRTRSSSAGGVADGYSSSGSRGADAPSESDIGNSAMSLLFSLSSAPVSN